MNTEWKSDSHHHIVSKSVSNLWFVEENEAKANRAN